MLPVILVFPGFALLRRQLFSVLSRTIQRFLRALLFAGWQRLTVFFEGMGKTPSADIHDFFERGVSGFDVSFAVEFVLDGARLPGVIAERPVILLVLIDRFADQRGGVLRDGCLTILGVPAEIGHSEDCVPLPYGRGSECWY